MTGIQPKPLEIFVEDDLAATIVQKLAAQLKIAKYVAINRYGAAVNCFTTVGGLLLGGEDCKNSLFVLDGDIYTTRDEKNVALKKVLTGHDEKVRESRELALTLISQFRLPVGQHPEKYLHFLIVATQESSDEETNEIIEVANEIVEVDNDHKYIDDIIERLGWERNVGLSKVIDMVATTSYWDDYVKDIRKWLEEKVAVVREK